MSLIDTLKSTVLGAATDGAAGKMDMLQIANQLLTENGGFAGLVQKFNSAGLSSTIGSWIGTNANLPISAEQIQKVLGSDQIQKLASQFGMDTSAVTSKLASGLPEMVDKLTPGGEMPSMQDLASKLTSLKGLLN